MTGGGFFSLPETDFKFVPSVLPSSYRRKPVSSKTIRRLSGDLLSTGYQAKPGMTGKQSNGLLFYPFNNNENIVYYSVNIGISLTTPDQVTPR